MFDDEVGKIAEEIGDLPTADELVDADQTTVRFYVPFRAAQPGQLTWEHIRLLQADDKASLGQKLTDIMREIAYQNQRLLGIIDRVDFNATTHGQQDMDDDQLGKLIGRISEKRLGLNDVEPDIIGRSYEYLIRKIAEGGGQSAGEFESRLRHFSTACKSATYRLFYFGCHINGKKMASKAGQNHVCRSDKIPV